MEIATIIVALVVAFIAWKLVSGIFKLLSVAAVVVIAAIIYFGVVG